MKKDIESVTDAKKLVEFLQKKLEDQEEQQIQDALKRAEEARDRLRQQLAILRHRQPKTEAKKEHWLPRFLWRGSLRGENSQNEENRLPSQSR